MMKKLEVILEYYTSSNEMRNHGISNEDERKRKILDLPGNRVDGILCLDYEGSFRGKNAG